MKTIEEKAQILYLRFCIKLQIYLNLLTEDLSIFNFRKLDSQVKRKR